MEAFRFILFGSFQFGVFHLFCGVYLIDTSRVKQENKIANYDK